MYRLLVESLLGISLEAGRLRVEPRVPSSWASFEVRYRHGGSVYIIALRPSVDGESAGIRVDGQGAQGDSIALVDDGREHRVEAVYPRGNAALTATRAPSTA
jgi:cellobiose phosphorylase